MNLRDKILSTLIVVLPLIVLSSIILSKLDLTAWQSVCAGVCGIMIGFAIALLIAIWGKRK